MHFNFVGHKFKVIKTSIQLYNRGLTFAGWFTD